MKNYKCTYKCNYSHTHTHIHTQIQTHTHTLYIVIGECPAKMSGLACCKCTRFQSSLIITNITHTCDSYTARVIHYSTAL